MKTQEENRSAEKLQNAIWDATMDTLERNWYARIADAQVEYRNEFVGLIQKTKETLQWKRGINT